VIGPLIFDRHRGTHPRVFPRNLPLSPPYTCWPPHLIAPNPCLATKPVHAVFQHIDGLKSRKCGAHDGLLQLGIGNSMAARLCAHEDNCPQTVCVRGSCSSPV
jgi:hypothetical protein